jgi:hypothetical protein
VVGLGRTIRRLAVLSHFLSAAFLRIKTQRFSLELFGGIIIGWIVGFYFQKKAGFPMGK